MICASLAVTLFLLQTPTKGTIDGAVVNAATGEPVPGAQVTLTAFPAGVGTGGGGVIGIVGGPLTGVLVGVLRQQETAPPVPLPPPQAPAVTLSPNRPPAPDAATVGSDGRFSFKDLNAGTYRITVTANGYARQEYGQRVSNGQGTPVYLTAGLSLKDLSIRLTATGTVSGHIADESGQPAVDVPVQLLRPAYTPQGKTFAAAGTALANDRGEYRIYGVTPGRYYLNIGSAPGPMRPGQPGFPNQGSTAVYAVSFYPGVTDLSQASLIEVKSAAEFIADMRVARQRMYRVRGRVMDSATGQAPPMVNVALNYRTVNGGGGSFSSSRNYDPATGTFELPNVIPGDYIVQAQIQEAIQPGPLDAAGLAARAAAAAARPAGYAPIHVINADVEGLLLTLNVGASVQGRLIVEGGPAPALTNLDRIRVGLRPSAAGVQNLASASPTISPIAADGTFRMDNLREGEYQPTILGIPASFYLKTASLDGADIMSGGFRFSGLASGRLDVVLGSDSAQISGTITDAQARPVPGVQVVLAPAQRNRTDLYKVPVTDQNGRFTITGIAPGEYTLFSWEAIEPFGYLDPDFVKQHESQGHAVHVGASSAQTVDARIIPAAAQ